MPEAWIREALDPVHSVKAHDMLGGPAPERVLKDLEKPKQRFLEDRKALEDLKQKVANGAAFMEQEIDRILNA